MDLYRHPRNEFVAQFLGTPKVNLFNAPNEQSNAGYRRWWHSVGDSNLQDVKKIGIRPESFLLVDNPDSLIAEVVLIEQLGDTSVLHCQIQGLKELMTVKLNGDAEVRQGQTIKLATPTQHVMHFNSQSQLATNKV